MRYLLRVLQTISCVVFLVATWPAYLPAQVVLREWNGVIQGGAGDGFGFTLTGLGDVDGDGVIDIGISAPNTHAGPILWAGRVYVFSGKTGRAVHVLSGSTTNQQFGLALSPAGDVDRDGHADFWAGSFPLLALFSGKTGKVLKSFAKRYTRVIGPGDVNGDGVPDVLLANPMATVNTMPWAGKVDLVSGKGWSVLATFQGQYPYHGFGAWLSEAGDLDADGSPDLLMNAGGTWPRTRVEGIWTYSGRTHKLLFHVPSHAKSDSFGINHVGTGDVNGDGYDDVALLDSGLRVTAPYFHILVYGGAASGGSTGRKLFTWQSPWTNKRIGTDLAAPGDVDGDGFADVLTGGLGAGGRAFLFSGRDQSLLFAVQGRINVHNIWPVGAAGDVDGDDFPDWLNGGYWDPTRRVGIVRLYSGAPVGVTAFGLGCKDGRGVIPRIGATREAKTGTTFQVNLSRTLPGRTALLLLGTSKTRWGSTSLPLDLAFAGLQGCLLRVSPDIVTGTVTRGPTKPKPKGRARLPLPVPADVRLRGQRFYAQWLVLGASGGGSITRALEITVQ